MQRFLSNVLRSCYDFSFYKEVYRNWKGWAMTYTIGVFGALLVVGLIAGTIIMHNTLIATREGNKPSMLEEGLRQIADQWPPSTVKDNVLTTHVPGAHVIIVDMDVFDEKLREEIITVDSSGSTTYANMTTPILITANEMIVKKEKDAGNNETEIHSLDELFKSIPQPFTLDATQMNVYVTELMKVIHQHAWKFYAMMGGIAWLFLVPTFVLLRLFLLIPLAVGGLIVASFMKRSLDYDASVRVIAMALIPLTIIEAFALIVFASGVSIWIKVLVSLGVLAALLQNEPKKA